MEGLLFYDNINIRIEKLKFSPCSCRYTIIQKVKQFSEKSLIAASVVTSVLTSVVEDEVESTVAKAPILVPLPRHIRGEKFSPIFLNFSLFLNQITDTYVVPVSFF